MGLSLLRADAFTVARCVGGKSVNVAVTPYSEGCCAGGSFLTVTDSASLVLAMNTDGCKVVLGKPDCWIAGITVTPTHLFAWVPATNSRRVRLFRTSAVSLAPGGVGSFKLGDMTFTAYAGFGMEILATCHVRRR